MKKAALIFLVLGFILGFTIFYRSQKPTVAAPVSVVRSTLAFTPFAPAHPCYKYSIVLCGAWTSVDAGLLNGYAVHANGGEELYSSFRIGNQIYWTRWPVRLHKGELLWTDGKRLIRARCGNELRPAPPTPPTNPSVDVADSELDGVIVLPAPTFPGVVFTSTLAPVDVQPPAGPPLVGIPVAGLPPIYGGCCAPVPVVTTPEGSGFLIWASALVAVGFGTKYKPRRK